MLSLYLLRMALSGSEALGIPHGPHGGDADRGQRPSPCLLRERNGGPGLGPAGDAPRERVRGRAGARAWWREAHLVRNRADRCRQRRWTNLREQASAASDLDPVLSSLPRPEPTQYNCASSLPIGMPPRISASDCEPSPQPSRRPSSQSPSPLPRARKGSVATRGACGTVVPWHPSRTRCSPATVARRRAHPQEHCEAVSAEAAS